MSVFQERIKVFRELPILKSQLEEQKLKIESLEKIKNSVSNVNFLSLKSSYEKQIGELIPKIDRLQADIVVFKNEIELDSKILEGENSLVEKELQELQFLSERGALSKQDYDSKRNVLKQKINKNKSHLSQNHSGNKELDFYATYIGKDNYLQHQYKEQTGSLKLKFSNIHPKVWVSIGVVVVLILTGIILYKPVKAVIVEKIAWNKAVKENSYESYDSFLSKFPNSKQISTAKAKQEDALWLLVKRGNTVALIERYISHYPSGTHINDANLTRDSLIWLDINKANNIIGYSKYLSLFPKGKYINEALAKITEMSTSNSLPDNRDGKVYKTVQIGNQVWMAENLAYKATSGCWSYEDNQENVSIYGYLYDWETAKNVCPSGWHLPTDVEWTELTNYLGGEGAAGSKLKEQGIIHWLNPNEGTTNETNFTAIPGGGRGAKGNYGKIRECGYWWTATTQGAFQMSAFSREMHFNDSHVTRAYFNKDNGVSVRCVKD